MRGLDDTDREIIRLLVEDARRPYSDIAEAVELSPPAVSDRVDRLQEIGLIERFTLDIDRSLLQDGLSVLIELSVESDVIEESASALEEADAVEHRFVTADGTIVVIGHLKDTDVRSFVTDHVDSSTIENMEVSLLSDSSWTPRLGVGTFAPECAECGNTVSSEGEVRTLDGDVYHFCCQSCESKFVERYEEFAAGVDN